MKSFEISYSVSDIISIATLDIALKLLLIDLPGSGFTETRIANRYVVLLSQFQKKIMIN